MTNIEQTSAERTQTIGAPATPSAPRGLSMSMTADFGDDTYRFRLTVPAGAAELEQKCDAGFAVVLARLASGAPRLVDIRETIRLGLIGGGLEPAKAMTLVRRYVDDRPLQENIILARTILLGLMYGFASDDATDITSRGDLRQPASPPAVTISSVNDLPGAAEGQPQGAQKAASAQVSGPIRSRLRGNG